MIHQLTASDRSMPAVLGCGVALATIIGVFEYTGGQLMPTGKDPQVDDFDRKEALKKRYRRPVQETINEIGEGRGILSNVEALPER